MAHAERKSLVEALEWRARVTGHRVARRADWLLRPGRYPAPVLAVGGIDAFPHLVHARDIPVRRAYGDGGVDVIDDPTLEAGKAVNLALAAPAFDGLLLEPGRPLSFWRALGPATAARGYQPGTELRGGCLVPSVGGGLCLLSNALHEMAVALGFAVLERHAHSARVPGQAPGRDATVFYPYVDLRVVPRHGRFRLEVAVTSGVLHLRAWSDAPPAADAPAVVAESRRLAVVGGTAAELRDLRRAHLLGAAARAPAARGQPVIAVVVPERVAWLDGLLARLRALDEVKVFDPSGGLVGRGVALGLHAWARGRAERVMAARFARRRAVDALAARWLPPLTRLVVAPSLGARRTFAAAAARRGVARVLVEDLPGFRQLHDDLDRAARDRPASTFLRRYRAPAPLLARQEAERVLADLLLVRGAFAAETRRALGVPAERVAVMAAGPARIPCPPRAPRAPGGGPRLLLAGLATGRSGVAEALQALAALPDATLLVRPGDGMEPADLLTRPRVRAARPHELAALAGVDVVLAPALCESYPPEVPLAAALGIPVVATRRAAGAVDLARAGAEIPPGDAAALAGAVTRVYSP